MLSYAERGVYHDICSLIWESGKGPTVDDLFRLAPGTRRAQLSAIVKTLLRYGKVTEQSDGSLLNERATREYQKAVELFEKQSAGGKKKGQGRQESQATWQPSQTRQERVRAHNERLFRELHGEDIDNADESG